MSKDLETKVEGNGLDILYAAAFGSGYQPTQVPVDSNSSASMTSRKRKEPNAAINREPLSSKEITYNSHKSTQAPVDSKSSASMTSKSKKIKTPKAVVKKKPEKNKNNELLEEYLKNTPLENKTFSLREFTESNGLSLDAILNQNGRGYLNSLLETLRHNKNFHTLDLDFFGCSLSNHKQEMALLDVLMKLTDSNKNNAHLTLIIRNLNFSRCDIKMMADFLENRSGAIKTVNISSSNTSCGNLERLISVCSHKNINLMLTAPAQRLQPQASSSTLVPETAVIESRTRSITNWFRVGFFISAKEIKGHENYATYDLNSNDPLTNS